MSQKSLLIVESPAKAKTIQKYIGKTFIVKASVGHIKDLPKSRLGVDLEKDFQMEYQLLPGKKKVLAELKKAAQNAKELYLATDPDREGEAIAWHIQEELAFTNKKAHRVLLTTITKTSVQEALRHPTTLNTHKFEAQKTRRILDRLVGYKVSPLLWEKVQRGLSAGRVQSVALRIVVEREKEILAFQKKEYWELEGTFAPQKASAPSFQAKLFKINKKVFELPDKKHTQETVEDLKKSNFDIEKLESKERLRRAFPPFITSTLQQDAANRLRFSAKKTMMLAQRLYEGMDLGALGTLGLITYMRTDSIRTDPQAIDQARKTIASLYGKNYLPEKPVFYKPKKSSQDAHEAIRPSSLEHTPQKIRSYLEKDEYLLYELIWNRFLASQMKAAVFKQNQIFIQSKNAPSKKTYLFKTTLSNLIFPGFLKIYQTEDTASQVTAQKETNKTLFESLSQGTELNALSWDPTQHFTQPPPRYTDASLIRTLEEKGIGRPSTYAAILSNIQDRGYAEKKENRYYPSELGMIITELLTESFPNVLDIQFTAKMEEQLDEIEEGKSKLKTILSTFWKSFEKALKKAKKQMKNLKAQEIPTDIACEKCKNLMVIKWGRRGSFLACSHYPECKNTHDYKKDDSGKIILVPKEETQKTCPKCQEKLIIKYGRFGKFLACENYPKCKHTESYTLGIPCPECKKGEVVERKSKKKRIFYGCNKWPKCKFVSWNLPTGTPCPECKYPSLMKKVTKREGEVWFCSQKECGYKEKKPSKDST